MIRRDNSPSVHALIGNDGKLLPTQTPATTGGAVMKQAVLDFGYPPMKTKMFNVIDTDVLPNTQLNVTNGNIDTDINDESFTYITLPKIGNFDITITAETKIGGNFKINYLCQ